jgi:TRAP-type C4-dicarboxylate transport system permease small subunit
MALAGAASLALLMVLVTVVDVVLRQAGMAIPGAFELVTLGMRVLVALAMPYAFWTGGHVAVELFTDRLSERLRAGIVALGLVLAGLVMALLVWASWGRAANAVRRGDITVDLGMPEIVFWIPLLVGAGLCVPVVALMAVRQAGIAFGILSERTERTA